MQVRCECGYGSDNSRNVKRHKTTCTARSFALQLQEAQKNNAHLSDENQALRDKLAKLSDDLDAERSRPLVQNTTTNNIVHVNILPFGEEPTPSWQAVQKLLQTQPEGSVARYIKMKHFDNYATANLRIPNKRARTMQIVEEDPDGSKRWVEKNRRRMIDKLAEDNLIELTDEFDAEKVARWRDWYHQSGLAGAGFDKTDAWKRLQEDVENMLLSQRANNVIT